ncbi:MAG: ATP-binding protein [Candidatus Bathyarchaeota archaeon]|nr:ATP-binding protein [Candidatus Termiticorpusculum sp.]
MKLEKLKPRGNYLNKLLQFKDIEAIKVITGIRRCGKSKLMNLFIEEIKKQGISAENIVYMNFESLEFDFITDYKVFYNYVKSKIAYKGRCYLFFDEMHNVMHWEKAVNSFRVDFDVDIYLTGSNATLLSSDISSLIAGRYVEIKMLPLSYKEFLVFHNIEKNEDSFQLYLKYGGFPSIVELGFNQDRINDVLEGIYNTVILKDVLEQSDIKNEVLLQKIVKFVSDNIGNVTSTNSIAGSLISNKQMKNNKKSPARSTVENYIDALKKAYIFYEAQRYDVKRKDLLKSLEKYYIVDVGMRNMLLGYRDVDRGHVLENTIYLELLRRDYKVKIGKIGEKEIDFIAEKTNEKIYIQVSETLNNKEILERELTPLIEIPDNYEKWIITNDKTFVENYEGIKIKNAINWLCE